jgi:hypothetical protein
MSSRANAARGTENLHAEHGYSPALAWTHDEQPDWIDTAGGPLLSVVVPARAQRRGRRSSCTTPPDAGSPTP